MANILSLDTSTEACSVALLKGDKIFERYEIRPREHATLLLSFIDDLLRESELIRSDLDAIAFGRGPGSFTGLRIATGVAQGLAFGLDLPLIPVSSLQTLAYEAKIKHECSDVLACLDARINEVYWAVFNTSSEEIELIGKENLCPPEEIKLTTESKHWFGAGNGWQFSEQMSEAVCEQITQRDASMLPKASAMLALAKQQYDSGKVYQPEEVRPHYLRDKVANLPK